MPMQEANIIEEKLDTARDFLESLRITNPRWGSKQKTWDAPWIFRGQANAQWGLIPSAWRSTNLERFRRRYRAKFENMHLVPLNQELEQITEQMHKGEIAQAEGAAQITSRSEQVRLSLEFSIQYFAEMQAVKEFAEFADRLGHPVPGANNFLRLQTTNYKDLPEEDYLISQFYSWTIYSDPFNVNCSAVALAQHHGVPTRLLDWTESPLIAAFFAAQAVANEKQVTGHSVPRENRIAVWALSKDICTGDSINGMQPSPLQLITRPRHEIGYLLAQKSVFTNDKDANGNFLRSGKWRSVEETLGNNPDYLKKLTLPVGEVGELLRLLWLESISLAHLMPTYDNVTRALQTKAWWENNQA